MLEEHQDMNPKPNTLADLYRELPKGRRCSLIYCEVRNQSLVSPIVCA